jgi:MoxR-like ATPase
VSQQPLVLEFRSGPLFKRFLLVDEINRARPRTQSALLQAMSEKGVEVQGEVRPLDPDFFLLATQNPTDFDGTYLLPRSQWDRFGCVLSFCHASGDDLQRKLKLACGEPKPLSVCELTKPRWKKPEVHDEWFRICAALQSYLDGKRALGAMSLSVRAWSSWLEMGAALSCLRGQQHLSTACLRATLLPCLFHRASESRSSELAEALLLEFDRQTSGR